MRLARAGGGWPLLAGAAVAIALVPLGGLGVYAMNVGFALMLAAVLAVSWNLLGGYAGYESFGHGVFFGIGAYGAAVLQAKTGLVPLLGAPAGGLVAAAVAWVVGYPALRLRGPYFALVTLAIALAIGVLILNLPLIDADEGVFVTPPATDPLVSAFILYESILVVLVLTVAIARAIERSRVGAALAAIREDEDVARTQGIPAVRLKSVTFALSAALAGLAGGVYAWSIAFIDPQDVLDPGRSILVVLFCFLGGRRSWTGAVLGAILVTGLQEMLSVSIGSNIAQIVYGGLLVAVILTLPNGLIGERPRLGFSRRSSAATPQAGAT